MFAKLLTGLFRKDGLVLILTLFLGLAAHAQDTIPGSIVDSSSFIKAINNAVDTVIARTSDLGLDANVEYESLDSIQFDMSTAKVYMYGEAKIVYDQIDLDAAYIRIEFNTNELIAEGVEDSTGTILGNPVFKEGDKTYNSKYMKYNYRTKKGYIKDVVTEEGEGFLHGTDILKLKNDAINISHGTYTTCSNPDHPHFGFQFTKAKVIPNKKIITGPATLVVEGVPTPLTIPFVMFPINPGQRSGVVMPTYGESANRGFFLEGGGYYWAINDFFDFKITGDIYSRGSWAVKPVMNYIKKYKYKGSLSLSFATNKTGTDNENETKDFSIRWSHNQDPKARPNGIFSANVNIMSSKFNAFNPETTTDFLSNTFQSSVSYQTNIAGKYRFTANASHSQNTKTKMVTISLPEVSFSVNQFYPFRKKGKAGQFKWYDNISMNYTLNARNTVNIADSLLFSSKALTQMKNGIKHSIPISSNLKVLKVFNLNIGSQLTNRTYFSRVEQEWVTDVSEDGTSISSNRLDTVGGFYNVFDFGFSANLTTKIYGQVDFKKTSALRAIRHVITPSVGFSYTPDFSKDGWGYYDYRYTNDDHSDSTKYSYYDNMLFGTASAKESGSINFSISNNLEIKVRDRNDTITGTKKIAIIDNFTINTSYNMVADSLKWSAIQLSGRTKLFKALDVTYSSTLDPYSVDSTGRRINASEWKVNKKLFRITNSSWRFGFRLALKSKQKSGGTTGKDPNEPGGKELSEKTLKSTTPYELRNINDHPEQYIDWTIPWVLNLSYNFNYTNTFSYTNMEKIKTPKIVQTLGIDGNVSITPKWKVEYRADYDFEGKKIAFAEFRILRDLHCWHMSFQWIPIGTLKSWSFTLNVKASVLQDLKLDKKKDFRDTY